MALIFTTTLTTPQGFEVTNAYGRVSVLDQKDGATLQAGLSIFTSEAAYLAGAEEIGFPQLGHYQGPYNRDVDGTDILMLAHTSLQTTLAAQGHPTTIALS